MVVVELILHTGQPGLLDPLGMRRIVAATYVGQGLPTQVEEIRLGDDAPALAALRVVEYLLALQCRAQVFLGQGAVGFFGQLAQAGLPQGVVRLDKSYTYKNTQKI